MTKAEFNLFLKPFLEPGFSINTRIHPITNYIINKANKVFIKREDELSSAISGSKFRKFASIIPYLVQNNFDEVVLVGGANSNNILGALQLLKEKRIPVSLLMLESNSDVPSTNELWIKMLLTSEKIRYLKRYEWPMVNKIADKYKTREEQNGRKIFILREGSLVTEGMPGAMTLAMDILRNEAGSENKFSHIFIDSGTGATAIGLILGLEILREKERTIHITLIAGSVEQFLEKLENMRHQASAYLKIPIPAGNLKFVFHKPVSSISFGSINSTVIRETIAIAGEEGILMEPVYSVKHIMTVKRIIDKGDLLGNCLVIYNGGSQGLNGFGDKILRAMKDNESKAV